MALHLDTGSFTGGRAKAQRREQRPRVTCGGSGGAETSQALRTYPTDFFSASLPQDFSSQLSEFLFLAPFLITQ